jgi:hypothetical protein
MARSSIYAQATRSISTGDVLIDRAEVLTIAGRPKEAAKSLTGALRLYRQKGNIVSTDRAEALLDELSDSGT